MTRIQGDPNYSTWPFFGQKSQCFQRISLNNYLVFEFTSVLLKCPDLNLEIDFVAFKEIVAALGGVDICFEYPTRDYKTALDVPTPGCYTLDKSQALAYARSRYFEVLKDGQWQIDGRADLGRIERQQIFLTSAVTKAIEQTTSNPLRTSELVNAAINSLTVDSSLNILETANFLRPLASGGMQRFKLAVLPETIDDKAVLVLGVEAREVLDYFAGVSGPPIK